MTRTTSSLTLASVIALLAATPTVASADPTSCTPSDPAALYACFHSAAFNVVDELDVYTQDLSAYGTRRAANSSSKDMPIAANRSNGTPINGTAASKPDLVMLRAFLDRKSTRLNSSHSQQSRMPSSA